MGGGGYGGGGGKGLGWREEKNSKEEIFILVQNLHAGGCWADGLHHVYVETEAAFNIHSNKQKHFTLIEHLAVAFVAFLIQEINVYHN